MNPSPSLVSHVNSDKEKLKKEKSEKKSKNTFAKLRSKRKKKR